MELNYFGPTVTLEHPSGSQESPTIFSLGGWDSIPVIQYSFTDPENHSISQTQVQVLKGDQVIWDSGPKDAPLDEQTGLMGDGLMYLFSLRHTELAAHKEIPFGEVYSVQMRAKDITEDPRFAKWGEWSQRKYFRVVLDPMAAFVAFNISIFANHREEYLQINWSDNSAHVGDVVGYNVYRSTHPGGPFQKINGSTALTARTFTDNTVQPHVRYYYQIEVLMSDGTSAYSPSTYGAVVVQYWSIGSFKFSGPTSFTRKRERAQSKRSVLGQRRVIQDKGFLPGDMQLEILLHDDYESTGEQKYLSLMTVLDQLTPVTIRDPFGRSWTVAPGAFEEQQLLTGKLEYRVKIDLSEVGA